LRTALTLLSAIIAFFLFGMLQGVDSSIKQAIAGLHGDRLITSNPALLPMPLAYRERIASVPGVTAVSYANGGSGYYRTPANRVVVFAVEADRYFPMYPDNAVSIDDLAALIRTKTGVLVTAPLAKKHGWKRGDRVSLHLAQMPKKDGSVDWAFQIVGFIDYKMAPDSPLAIINFAYFDSARLTNNGTIERFLVKIDDAAHAGAASSAIDAQFVNAPMQTRTMTERDMAQGLFNQIGDVGFFANAIIGAVFFTLLLLVGNALMQSYRERIREFAVMKALGFSDNAIAGLVIGEALLLCLIAAIAGFGTASWSLSLLGAMTGNLWPTHVSLPVVLMGIGVAGLVSIASAAIPALRAKRLAIADALSAH
jgi:putative ABC transport system permease protein